MVSENWLFVLRSRMGDHGATALCEALDASRDEIMTLATERFENRLAEECGKLRTEMHEMRSDLRGEVAGLRVDMASLRADMMKWAFLFWVGQAVTLGGLMTILK